MNSEIRSSLPNQEVDSQEVIPGEYLIEISFKKRNGENYELKLENPIELTEGEDITALKKRALSAAVTAGLHNYGMDVYSGRYPDGHPVNFKLKHTSGLELTFSNKFDASGYAVKEK